MKKRSRYSSLSRRRFNKKIIPKVIQALKKRAKNIFLKKRYYVRSEKKPILKKRLRKRFGIVRHYTR